jgi:radical SAM superfamily enzyme YgiQ (UPF0313 family)
VNIVFVNPPTGNPYPKPPLGLLQVATACKRYGYDVRILDADLLKLDVVQITDAVADADAVGITAMTPAYETALSIADHVYFGNHAGLIIGGVHATIFPEHVKSEGYFDAVIAGEGEESVIMALRAIEGGDLTPTVYEQMPLDYDTIPVPDYSLIDVAAYRPRHPHGERLPWTAVHTSRGCPSRCTFCSKAVFGSCYRGMSAKSVHYLMQSLAMSGVRDITFYDDEFMLDQTRLSDLCDALLCEPLDLTWTCEARVTSVLPLPKARAAGCRLVYLGIESGNDSILRTLRKGFTTDRVRRAVEMCQAASIKVAGYFMLGCPGETEQTIRQTVDFADELGLDHAQFSICTPLPGSELYAQYGDGNGAYLGDGAKPVLVPPEIGTLVTAAVDEANARWAK